METQIILLNASFIKTKDGKEMTLLKYAMPTGQDGTGYFKGLAVFDEWLDGNQLDKVPNVFGEFIEAQLQITRSPNGKLAQKIVGLL